MIALCVFQSRDFLLILYRERHILKLIKFWLSLLTRVMGNRLVRFDDFSLNIFFLQVLALAILFAKYFIRLEKNYVC